MRAYSYAAALTVTFAALSAIALIAPFDPDDVARPVAASTIVEDERRFAEALLDAINDERRYADLPPLQWDPQLASAAENQLDAIAVPGGADPSIHRAPSLDLLDRAARTRFPLTRETVWSARNHADWRREALAKTVLREWMGQPGAFAALVDPTITHAGGAIARDAFDGRAAMLFGGPSSGVLSATR